MFGLLNIYKPRGISSYDVIRHLRRGLGRKLKLGHAGTLDPLAEGVLVLCLGPATKLVQVIQAYPKEYLCLARLGATSTTDDAEGEIQQTPAAAAPADEAVRAAVGKFVGAIEQVPPAHSAVKVGGQRAYKIARRGRTPELSAKTVTVHSLEVVGYEYPHLRLKVRCGSGTYIRALVRDIGRALGVGGYCTELVRTAVGPFAAENAVRIEQIQSGQIQEFLIGPGEAMPAGAKVPITDTQVRELLLGRTIQAPDLPPAARGHDLLGAVAPDGRLIGLVRLEGSPARLRPVKIFGPTQAP